MKLPHALTLTALTALALTSCDTIEQCTYSKTSGITRAAMTYGQTDYRDNIKGI